MAELQTDPFISVEPEVEIDEETQRILQDRMRSADNGQVVSSAEARERILQWLSNSSTSKTR